jgi:hypothetical protein
MAVLPRQRRGEIQEAGSARCLQYEGPDGQRRYDPVLPPFRNPKTISPFDVALFFAAAAGPADFPWSSQERDFLIHRINLGIGLQVLNPPRASPDQPVGHCDIWHTLCDC